MRYLFVLTLSLLCSVAWGDGQPLWQQRTGGGGNQQLSGVRATSISVVPSELWVDKINATSVTSTVYVGYPTPLPTSTPMATPTPMNTPTPQPTPTPVDLSPYTQRAVNEPITGIWQFNGDSGPDDYSLLFNYVADIPTLGIKKQGSLHWGSGSGALDTVLQRSTDGTLQILNHFKIGADSAGTAASDDDYLYLGGQAVHWDESTNLIQVIQAATAAWKYAKPEATADPQKTVLGVGYSDAPEVLQWGVQNSGELGWGPVEAGTSPDLFDTHLWRKEAGVLQTEGLYVNGTITAGTYAGYPTPLPTATPQPTPTPIAFPLSAASGGTGQNSSGWTGFPIVASGTWSAQSPGSGNQVLGMNNGATGAEWKTVSSGDTDRVTVTHGAGTITLSGPQDLNTGSAVQHLSLLLGNTGDVYPLVFQASDLGTVGKYIGIKFGYNSSSYQKAAIFFQSVDNQARGNIIFGMDPDTGAGNVAVTDGKVIIQGLTGNVGIGDMSPASLFTVGDGDKFQVDASGNTTIASGGKLKGGHTDVIHYQDVLAEDDTAIYSGGTLANGDMPSIAQPDVPRAMRLYITVTGGSGQTATITISGTDADGAAISQVWTGIDLGSAWEVTTDRAYALLTAVTASAVTGSYSGTIEVGITAKLGLPNYPFNAAGDVFKQKRNNSNESVGSVSATYGTVDVTTVTGGDDLTWWVRPYK